MASEKSGAIVIFASELFREHFKEYPAQQTAHD